MPKRKTSGSVTAMPSVMTPTAPTTLPTRAAGGFSAGVSPSGSVPAGMQEITPKSRNDSAKAKTIVPMATSARLA